MFRVKEVIKSLANQLTEDANDVRSVNEELEKLRPAYRKYIKLADTKAAREQRIQHLAQVLRDNVPAEKLIEIEKIADIELEMDFEAPLWKDILEIVRQVPEIQAVELEEVLEELGFEVTRQAIESAIRQHEDQFMAVKRGREKFISLREKPD